MEAAMHEQKTADMFYVDVRDNQTGQVIGGYFTADDPRDVDRGN